MHSDVLAAPADGSNILAAPTARQMQHLGTCRDCGAARILALRTGSLDPPRSRRLSVLRRAVQGKGISSPLMRKMTKHLIHELAHFNRMGTRRFFGKKSPPLPDRTALIAVAWREVHEPDKLAWLGWEGWAHTPCPSLLQHATTSVHARRLVCFLTVPPRGTVPSLKTWTCFGDAHT